MNFDEWWAKATHGGVKPDTLETIAARVAWAEQQAEIDRLQARLDDGVCLACDEQLTWFGDGKAGSVEQPERGQP